MKTKSLQWFVGIPLFVVCSLFVWVGIASAGHNTPPTFHNAVEMHGWAWSDTIGWISFNCDNEDVDTCTTYQVVLRPNYEIDGYAWSSNIGWVRFAPFSSNSCPNGSECGSRINDTKTEFLGWARACSVLQDPTSCTGDDIDPNAGGWDGWISLNCENVGSADCSTGVGNTDYAVKLGSSDGTLASNSYAWGSTNVGWTDFSKVTFDPPCGGGTNMCLSDYSGYETYNQWCESTIVTCPVDQFCTDASPGCGVVSIPHTLTVTPALIRSGGTVKISWEVNTADADSCIVTQPSGNTLAGLSGDEVESESLTRQINIFTLSCVPAGGGPLIDLEDVEIKLLPTVIET